LLEKVKKLDPSNIDARIKLAFSYMATAGISHVDTIKKFATLGSAGSDLKALSSVGLDEEQVAKLKASEKNVSLMTAEELRGKLRGA
jgi:hypothetical protein